MINSEMIECGYNQFVSALEDEVIDVKESSLIKGLYLHEDRPTERDIRFTYVFFDKNDSKKVIAFCAIVFSGIVLDSEGKKIAKWQIGWFVDESYRKQGLGYEIPQKSIEDFILVNKGKYRIDLIEATVDEGNSASLKIARKLIGNEKVLTNKSGVKTHSFLKFV